MTRRLQIFFWGFAAVFLCGAAFAADDAEQRKREHADAWAQAAENRFLAAVSQQEEAAAMQAKAEELRHREYVDAADRLGNWRAAGDAEYKAGDLLGGAAGNYEKAAANASKAVLQYRQLGEEELVDDLGEVAQSSRERTFEAMRGAASAYEMSAEDFGADGADQPVKAAAASEKAAVWREKLAQKQ